MATPAQVIEAVRSAFNAKAMELAFGTRAVAHLPVKFSDLTTPPTYRGGDSKAVAMCRHLCIYTIAQHCVAADPILNRERQYSYEAIGRIFGRTKVTVHDSVKACCAMIQEPVYRDIYAASIASVEASGAKLLNVRKRTPCEP